ncbi:hypothetical protein HNW13_018115 [Shewanella sp. BF02_Schw]|uniref:hypothetical protein n=1 Tax=Shewanella sp. BF02_Schw TaxID=394908 RepID=UPI0017873ECE|nr:hypothetical protein [Shewanella sp. BF02_Schw]MBO1897656.1 hypothetical protein [Shewanella sp. BF02_Schw]
MKNINEHFKFADECNTHSERANRWINRYLNKNDDQSIYSFIDWFVVSILPNVTSNSGRNYLRSLILCLKEQDVVNYLHVQASEVQYKHKDKSKKKSKSISWEHFAAIDEELTKNGLEQLFISDWLRCSILTGLRPKEWCSARAYYDTKGRLVLRAKNTVKASTSVTGDTYTLPEYRIIPLMNYDKADIECIKRHLAYIKITLIEGLYEACYQTTRAKLYHTSKKLFPELPLINLYSGRHQFAANLKKSNLSATSIALLMGHNDNTTARHSYGAKRHGESGVIDIDSTEQTLKLFQELFVDEG